MTEAKSLEDREVPVGFQPSAQNSWSLTLAGYGPADASPGITIGHEFSLVAQ
jgi:hypothetical protein